MGPIVIGVVGAFLLGGSYSFLKQRKSPIAVGIMAVVGLGLIVSAAVQMLR